MLTNWILSRDIVEEAYNMKRALITIALSLMVWGCGASRQHGAETQVDNPDAPVIIDYYAAEVIRPGATWRVYLHARDKNGDMRDIACVLVQRGHGTYPTSVTRLSEGHREEVAGFRELPETTI
jgi:hypothetical protein